MRVPDGQNLLVVGGDVEIDAGGISAGLTALINARYTMAIKDALGQGGDIRITTGALSLTNNAQLIARTLGGGDSGNVIINARDIAF